MRIIAGAWRGRRLKALKGRSVRPTTDRVREAWMSALGGHLPDLRVLDLFSGSGALGLESLSRGADAVVFVDKARSSIRVLEANIELLQCQDRVTVVHGDAMKYVSGLPTRSFDVALADPPYGEGFAAALLERFHEDPFADELWVEHRTDEPLPAIDRMRHRRYGDTTLTTLDAEPDAP